MRYVFNGPVNSVNVHQVNGYSGDGTESKDDILKARFEPQVADAIKAFCRGRKITITDYFRKYASLGDLYFDHIDTLRDPEIQKMIIPLLERLTLKH